MTVLKPFVCDFAVAVCATVLLCGSSGATVGEAERLVGHCVSVPRADVLEVWLGPEADVVMVRLAGIDRKSIDNAFPRYAHLLTSSRALDQPLRIEVVNLRPDGSLLGRVMVDHEDLSFLLVSEGLASSDGLAPAAMRLAQAEAEARAAGRGLWAAEAEAERARQRAAARELRLGDIAWRLDAKRRAVGSEVTGRGEGDGDLVMELRSWVGVREEILIVNWGAPSAVEGDARGGRVLGYDRCGANPGVREPGCSVRFFVNANGYVYDREYRDAE